MESITYPRVLVISHNAFHTTNNMGKTISSLFKGWDSNKLAQLYFQSEFPDSKLCENYFRITDKELLKSFFRGIVPGKELVQNDAPHSSGSNTTTTTIQKIARKRKPYMFLARDLLWKTNAWKTIRLISWVENFNPEVIFVAPGAYCFSIEIALYLQNKHEVPLIAYFGDDYYFQNHRRISPLYWANKHLYKKSFLRLFSNIHYFIAASDEMKVLYEDEFGKPGSAILKSCSSLNVLVKNKKTKVVYIGNLGVGRWRSLVDIGQVLKKLGLFVHVYSGEKRSSILQHLNKENGIIFCGHVSSDEVESIISESTILLHVEALGKDMRERVKYSMSTKIPESLGSGVCLFAYGPDDVSSIEYLTRNEAACVVTNKEDLQVKLSEIIDNEELRKKYINNALKLASERHDFETNTKLFYKIITDACEDWKSRLEG
jgi:glycosyltransferase involved in cell wall biosynthesis